MHSLREAGRRHPHLPGVGLAIAVHMSLAMTHCRCRRPCDGYPPPARAASSSRAHISHRVAALAGILALIFVWSTRSVVRPHTGHPREHAPARECTRQLAGARASSRVHAPARECTRQLAGARAPARESTDATCGVAGRCPWTKRESRPSLPQRRRRPRGRPRGHRRRAWTKRESRPSLPPYNRSRTLGSWSGGTSGAGVCQGIERAMIATLEVVALSSRTVREAGLRMAHAREQQRHKQCDRQG